MAAKVRIPSGIRNLSGVGARGALQGCKCTAKRFDLSKIWAKSQNIWAFKF